MQAFAGKKIKEEPKEGPAEGEGTHPCELSGGARAALKSEAALKKEPKDKGSPASTVPVESPQLDLPPSRAIRAGGGAHVNANDAHVNASDRVTERRVDTRKWNERNDEVRYNSMLWSWKRKKIQGMHIRRGPASLPRLQDLGPPPARPISLQHIAHRHGVKLLAVLESNSQV